MPTASIKGVYEVETPTTRVWHQLFSDGSTNDEQSGFWRVPKAPEELYDLEVWYVGY